MLVCARPQGHFLVTCPLADWAGWLALRLGWTGALPALQKLQGPVTPKLLCPSFTSGLDSHTEGLKSKSQNPSTC